MSDKNMDIKMSPHFVSAEMAGKKGYVKMGVDSETILDIQANKYLIALYLVNKEQFNKLKMG